MKFESRFTLVAYAIVTETENELLSIDSTEIIDYLFSQLPENVSTY